MKLAVKVAYKRGQIQNKRTKGVEIEHRFKKNAPAESNKESRYRTLRQEKRSRAECHKAPAGFMGAGRRGGAVQYEREAGKNFSPGEERSGDTFLSKSTTKRGM